MALSTNDFREFANSMTSGFLKSWKANSMVYELSATPEICAENERLDAYVANCLKMEGFSDSDCAEIAAYIKSHI